MICPKERKKENRDTAQGNVGSIVTSLDGESETSEEEAETDAVDEVNQYPLNSGGLNVKEGHKADADGCGDPSGLERLAVVADFGDDDAADDGGRDDGEELGKGCDAGPCGGDAFDGFVVEGEIV